MPDKTRAEMERAESEVRNGELVGREAYEASLAALPTYHDGTPRPSWDDLPGYARRSWYRKRRKQEG